MAVKMERRRLLTVAGAIVLAGAIVAAAYLIVNGRRTAGLELEDNATVGIMPGVDMDQRLRELQAQLDNSKIAFSINTNPLFERGEGNLMLENPGNNAKLLTAQMVLSQSGEVVYSSKAIRPGSYLERVKLDKQLKPGTYDATVYLKAYDQATQELIGQTGAQITLTVVA